MDLKKDHERAVSVEFIAWYNAETGRDLSLCEEGEAPDARFEDADGRLGVEVTTAWYSQEHAAWTVRHARNDPNVKKVMSTSSPDFDKALASEIEEAVRAKAGHRYDCEWILVVAVYPYVTSAEELAPLLSAIKLPDSSPFVGVYVVGSFPESVKSTGGYRCLRVGHGSPPSCESSRARMND